MAEIDEHRRTVEAELASAQAQTHAEEDALTRSAEEERTRLNAEAAAERDRLEAEAQTHRALADEDFELTLRGRRTAAYAEMERERAEAHAEATQLIEDAKAEVLRLAKVRDEAHEHLRNLHDKLASQLEESLATVPTAE
jgi:hypothetical protein